MDIDVKELDVVRLVSGETATVVYVHKPGVAYEADIQLADGETLTDTIRQEQIQEVIYRANGRG